MSQENPQNIIRSYASQSNWAGGAVLTDRLVPPAFSRIRTPFIQTWREDSGAVANLDWDASAFSVYLPESLRVVRAIFLKINLPLITGAGGTYKTFPASLHPSHVGWSGGVHVRCRAVPGRLLRIPQRRAAPNLWRLLPRETASRRRFRHRHRANHSDPHPATQQPVRTPQRARYSRVRCVARIFGAQQTRDPV